MDTPQQLTQIADSDVAKIASIHSGTLNLGPLTVNWNLDITVPQIIVDATLHGISIGHVVVNPSNPTATLGGNIGIAEAEVVLTADFTKNQLDYHAIVKLFGKSLFDKTGTLVTW